MVTIKCKESGVEFEAETKRTKQHPLIAELKAVANKNRTYREVNNALAEVRKAGGYTSIEEFMTLVDENLKAKFEKADELAAFRREETRKDEEEREKRKQEREEQNRILKDNGYIWRKEAVGTEDSVMRGSYHAGIGEFSHYEFRLYAPNGREITVVNALEEIERGADTQAEQDAKIEDEKLVEKQEQAEKEQKQASYDAIEAQAEKLTEVEDIDFETWNAWETIASHRLGMTTYTIKRGKINAVLCYVISQYGDMDYSRYFCASPVLAGLTQKVQTDDDFRFSDWF